MYALLSPPVVDCNGAAMPEVSYLITTLKVYIWLAMTQRGKHEVTASLNSKV